MTKSAATENALGELHSKVAKIMHKALDQFEVKQEMFETLSARAKDDDDVELLVQVLDKDASPNASFLSVVTKFLNDNKISCAVEESAELTGLAARLAGKKKKRVGNVTYLADGETG